MEIKIAGDSHGTKMIGFIEDIPAGLKIDEQKINDNLRRRQLGYGRGKRMKIETDQVQVIAGTWNGVTTGAPVVIEIENKARNPINTND
ncbi:MAG: chorismate synthase, partial [Defluviitoga tunisiensis]|nr:chorismate synthase [Defluviitoga tunisiensis]